MVHLPHSVRIRFGTFLGALFYQLAHYRRHITEVNLTLCFPELSAKERQTLTRKVFRSIGISIIEMACVWLRDPRKFRHLVQINGLEHLESALARGKGVILLGVHLSTLDFCGAILSTYVDFDIMYRRNSSALLDAIIQRGRNRNFVNAIERQDIRSVIKSLKQGHAVWYGSDQDYGRRHSVFVPFFNQPAATITATARLAQTNGSPVIMLSHYRTPDDSRYEIFLSEPITSIPTDDPEFDARTINQRIEQAVLRQPEQYWWVHRRFKTAPEGRKSPY